MKKYIKLLLYSFLLFFVGILVGGLFRININIEQSSEIGDVLLNPSIDLVFNFFKNNIIVFFLIAIGFITFSVPTIIILMTNGFYLGYIIVSNYSINKSIEEVCLSILPHGIFEIIGLLIGGVIGLKGLKFYFINNKKDDCKIVVKLLVVGAIFILIAAIIEGFITPMILKKYI